MVYGNGNGNGWEWERPHGNNIGMGMFPTWEWELIAWERTGGNGNVESHSRQPLVCSNI